MSARYEMRLIGVFDRQLGRVIRSRDPEWRDYEAARLAGESIDPLPVPAAAPDQRFDPVLAGRAREERQLEKLANKDPLTAALVAAGIQRRPTR